MKPQWVYRLGIAGSKQHDRLFRDDKLGVQLEIHTPVLNNNGPPWEFGEPKLFFSIDGDRRIFRSEETMLRALAKKPKHKTGNV